MKVNSPESLETGKRLLEEHGSWDDVRQKARVTQGGVYVVGYDARAVQEALRRLGEKAA